MAPEPSEGHVFISYVREDAAEVDRIQQMLEAAGVRVWRDTEDLWPGEDWRIRIRQAITNDSLVFLACFSDHSASRTTTYQNEELLLAVEQLRLRPPDKPWLIPVRLSECVLPQYDLGAGRTLDSLQRVELFGEQQETGVARLVAGVLRVFESLGHRAEAGESSSSVAEVDAGTFVKQALLDPARQIELEDYVMAFANEAAQVCSDDERFPATSPNLTDNVGGVRFLVDQANRYWETVEPLLAALIPGCTWGQPHHSQIWARAVERVANTAKSGDGKVALLQLRRLPILPLLYGSTLAALHRGNFGNLKAVAIDAQFRDDKGSMPLVGAAHVWRPFAQVETTAQVLALQADGEEAGDDVVDALRRGRRGKRYTPVSDYLHRQLRPFFNDLIPDEEDYTTTFDRLEVLLGVLATDAKTQAASSGRYLDGAWFGSFIWRDRYASPALERRMLNELRDEGDQWRPLTVGLFGGKRERANAAFETFITEAAQTRGQRW